MLAEIKLILCLASVEISQRGNKNRFLVAWNLFQMNMLPQSRWDATRYQQPIVFDFFVSNRLFADNSTRYQAVIITMSGLSSSFPRGRNKPWVRYSPYFAQSGWAVHVVYCLHRLLWIGEMTLFLIRPAQKRRCWRVIKRSDNVKRVRDMVTTRLKLHLSLVLPTSSELEYSYFSFLSLLICSVRTFVLRYPPNHCSLCRECQRHRIILPCQLPPGWERPERLSPALCDLCRRAPTMLNPDPSHAKPNCGKDWWVT